MEYSFKVRLTFLQVRWYFSCKFIACVLCTFVVFLWLQFMFFFMYKLVLSYSLVQKILLFYIMQELLKHLPLRWAQRFLLCFTCFGFSGWQKLVKTSLLFMVPALHLVQIVSIIMDLTLWQTWPWVWINLKSVSCCFMTHLTKETLMFT